MAKNTKPVNKDKRRIKAAITISIAVSSTAAYSFFCPPQYQENFVEPQFMAAMELITGAVTAVDVALSTQLEINSQRLLSAIAVLTKQKAIAANQIADSARTADQQVATSLNVLSQTERVKQAKFDFSGEFGQGFSPCKVYSQRHIISMRDTDMGNERRYRVSSEVVAAPGRYYDPILGQEELLKANRKFCTEDQVNSGLCNEEGELPAASTNAATLFEPAMEGSDLYDAKVAFVNNLVGLPDGSIPPSAGKSAAAEAYMLEKSYKDAAVSPAIVALKEVQLDYSGVDGMETGKDIPLALHYKNEVGRYLGNTEENENWTNVLVAQNDRGLMVELLKMNALKLSIQEKMYRQYELEEAMLASLVGEELRQSGVAGGTSEAANDAAKKNVTKEIQ